MQYTLLTGSVNSAIFAEFVRSLPASRPIILDNCAIHKTQAVRALCAENEAEGEPVAGRELGSNAFGYPWTPCFDWKR